MTGLNRFFSPSTTKHHHDQNTSIAAAGRIFTDARNRLANGEAMDVADLLQKNPELKLQKSFVLSLAHEEYCRRLAAGESVDADDFCERFPSFKNSLYMVIELNRLLENDPEFQLLCKEPKWPEAGDSFLNYQLITELGRGSFAQVFLASEPALGGRIVVLKIAPRGGAEAEVVGKLRHPNIVPVHSIKEDPESGLTAICMPYLGRTTLCDVLDIAYASDEIPVQPGVILQAITELHDDPKLPEAPGFDGLLQRGSYVEAIVHIVAQIADALSYTHSRGICHLDLKPSNVLLSIEGRPLLLDFNLSVEGEMDAWKIGGTLPYMSPEQLKVIVCRDQRLPSHPDPRSDLFSLGIIAYQLLCGELPFGPVPRESSAAEISEKLLQRQELGPLSLREKNPWVDGRLAAVVESCLAFDPEDRPQSAQILTQALRKQLTPLPRSRRWIKNHPRRVFLAAAAMLTVVCAAGLFFALRAPYSVRQFRQGQYYAEQGEYRLAAECLDKSVEANPEDPEVLFARGRVRQKLGQYDLAADDYSKALKIKPDAKLYACRGFCASKLNRNANAEMLYLKALDAGFQSPGLFNNLGYAFLKLNRLEEAEGYLNKALEMDPYMQAAHNNLLFLHVQRSGKGAAVAESILIHAKRTIETAPPSGELYHQAAVLFALAGKKDSRWVQPAKQYARQAINHGWDARILASDPGLLYLHEDPEFQNLLTSPASMKTPAKPVLLVNPLEDGRTL